MARYTYNRVLVASVLATVASAGLLVGASTVSAHAAANSARVLPAHVDRPSSHGSRRAPTGPPLISGPAGPGTVGGELGGVGKDASESAPSSSGDPLVSNGLGSPSCTSGTATVELSLRGERDCQLSGFQATGAPTSNYAFDVHIETGFLGLGSGAVSSAVQNLLVTPVWMGLVWVVHGLIVALEWCYTIDLLESSAMSGIAGGLRAARATFTQPWLVVVLAIAGVLAAYNGLVRRRVAETLGQALLMLVMIAGGLWVIVDPLGTIGTLGAWTNQASVGALGMVAQGSPAHGEMTLADGLDDVFAAGVGAPWCYMEFGNVRWCEDPHRRDPRLRAAALGLAASDEAHGGEQAQALEQSARLLREAHTNGELFLALPANQVQRNSISQSSSLLRVLCDSEDATGCRGPTAKQAEFRTEAGTWPRVEGLLLIVIGGLGMILLLGFIALRLLGAAIMSLFYLLLAPAAVLAPALGDGGRAAFRGWATRLLGAVTAKLMYSLMLGVVLLMMRILLSLETLGWWIQWLLVSVLWWSAFRHRDALWSSTFRHHSQVLGLTRADRGGASRVGGLRLTSALMSARETGRFAGWAKRKILRPPQNAELRQGMADAVRERAKSKADGQVTSILEQDHRSASKQTATDSQTQSRQALGRSQLQRVRAAREDALKRGETRRAAKLDIRAKRIEGETARRQRELDAARRITADGRAGRRSGGTHTEERRQARARWLDAQAALPDSAAAPRGARRRDYPALAGLVGYERSQYEQLSPGSQRQARLDIDRELALRRELNKAATGEWEAGKPKLHAGEQRRAAENFDHELKTRLSADGRKLAPSLQQDSATDTGQQVGRDQQEVRARTTRERPDESQLLRDARKSAAARKRQLGR